MEVTQGALKAGRKALPLILRRQSGKTFWRRWCQAEASRMRKS